ncbi:glutathione S-transferase T3-like [Eutrema salsugineum]|uniref:glutathione S-transferase T3-like n=1 Tax=Eutrema salsugineum TaxID=72664 RepID=UPI000CED2B10|nr:glutathione S-transferase T3-like [Eutrema salsugineum]
MDSANSFGNSPGFVNLLASQEDNTFNFSPTIDLSSSEVPCFSSQLSQDDPSPVTKDRVPRRIWSPVEDIVLISAWLNTSKDPVVGNDQKAGAFWSRIQGFFNNSPKLADYPNREATTCKQRWGRINDQVCKFSGCYETALKQQTSGQNDDDLVKTADQLSKQELLQSKHKMLEMLLSKPEPLSTVIEALKTKLINELL